MASIIVIFKTGDLVYASHGKCALKVGFPKKMFLDVRELYFQLFV